MDVTFPSKPCGVTGVRGITLTEVIIVMAIGAILLGMALPTFSNIINDNQLSAQVNEFISQLNYARSEAIKTGERVQVCKSTNGSSCDNGAAWNEGWITFIDKDSDRQRSSDETLLLQQQPVSQELTIDYGGFPTDNYVIYYPSGMSLGNGTFTFCDSRGDDKAHALVLYKTGRLRAADVMPDGTPLSCP